MRYGILVAVLSLFLLPVADFGNSPVASAQRLRAVLGPDAQPGQTLGGPYTWADELLYNKWRIQRNVFTGHCRLLDGKEVRHARGTFETCLAKLEQIKREQNLPPMKGKAVLVLSGLGDSRIHAEPLAEYLEQEGGFLTFCVGYPSLFSDVGTFAKSLASVIKHLDGVTEIDLVGHSLGNLVIRRYLGDQTDAAKGLTPDPRIKRIVMIAPPNNGSELAVQYADHPAFVFGLGAAGQELGKRWNELAPTLATPACEFGIIAGGRGDDGGLLPKFEGNDLLPTLKGDNDGVLTVASTRLPGATDFIVVRRMHVMMLNSRTVMEYTLRFLEHGYFVAADKRNPIPKDK
jgi:pimeloyl-ACP methyl ester carboxylesterase